ncbi:hypothetical protein [Aquimarina algicola]|uniref:Histidine kinase n=1 Tax=Aquimarina algicola TaxID=2589995 RepID=A0A504JLL9_9FLAO|nr:hypothetical protein [Aquimarina algicola]TPN89285.1 hypothetical protein FHK87_03390 [Aquimarina algicola]
MNNQYNLTLIGLITAISVYLSSVILNLDLFEKFVAFLENLEQFKFDKIIIPLLIFFVFFVTDSFRRNTKLRIEKTKLNIYKAMLSSSHHILNNFIYQMDIFKITAEDTPGFDAKVLSFYQDIIDNASHQIRALSTLTTIDENSIKSSVLQQ